jgi:hypothetical protein
MQKSKVYSRLGTLTTSGVSEALSIASFYNALQVVVSGASSLTATVTVEATIDGVNWSELDGIAQSVTTDGVKMFVVSEVGGIMRLRVKIAVAAGSGTFECIGATG